MRAVVADTSPLNYLVLIGAVELLPRLYSEVIIPPAVGYELSHSKTPDRVREYFVNRPRWLKQQSPIESNLGVKLDLGEREAISLALELKIGGLLLDDWDARNEAVRYGLLVTGTIGILATGSQNGWIDFDEQIERLRQTNFRVHEGLISDARVRLHASNLAKAKRI